MGGKRKSVIKNFILQFDIQNRSGLSAGSLYSRKEIFTNFQDCERKYRRLTSKYIEGVINENRDHQFCTKAVERDMRK